MCIQFENYNFTVIYNTLFSDSNSCTRRVRWVSQNPREFYVRTAEDWGSCQVQISRQHAQYGEQSKYNI